MGHSLSHHVHDGAISLSLALQCLLYSFCLITYLVLQIEGHVGNDEEAKGNTQGTNGEQGTAAEVVGKALEPVANGKDTEMIDVSSEVHLTARLPQAYMMVFPKPIRAAAKNSMQPSVFPFAGPCSSGRGAQCKGQRKGERTRVNWGGAKCKGQCQRATAGASWGQKGKRQASNCCPA